MTSTSTAPTSILKFTSGGQRPRGLSVHFSDENEVQYCHDDVDRSAVPRNKGPFVLAIKPETSLHNTDSSSNAPRLKKKKSDRYLKYQASLQAAAAAAAADEGVLGGF